MTAGPALVDVRLLELPLDLHERLQAHVDGLLREFRLLVDQAGGSPVHVPSRLLALVRELQERYAGVGDESDREIEGALARGEHVLPELLLQLPADASGACTALREALVEADAFCRAGQLLILATPQELADYRDWYLLQIVAQLAGASPVAWSSSAGPAQRPVTGTMPGW